VKAADILAAVRGGEGLGVVALAVATLYIGVSAASTSASIDAKRAARRVESTSAVQRQ
jgi:hypothetical protein